MWASSFLPNITLSVPVLSKLCASAVSVVFVTLLTVFPLRVAISLNLPLSLTRYLSLSLPLFPLSLYALVIFDPEGQLSTHVALCCTSAC